MSPISASSIICKVFVSGCVFLMLISCAFLPLCPSLFTMALQGLWIEWRRKHALLCREQHQCCFPLFTRVFSSLSSSVKVFVLSIGFLSVSPNPFLFYRFLQELLISSPCITGTNIPRFSLCCPHFYSMLNLLLGDVKREMSCAVLICPEAQRGCVCALALMSCVRLLFSEYQSPLWTRASCAVI